MNDVNHVLRQVVAHLVTLAIFVAFAWVAFRILAPRINPSFFRPFLRADLDGFVPAAHAVPSEDGPRTFSGLEHEHRYRAPEELAEALEVERDIRWARRERIVHTSPDGIGPGSVGEGLYAVARDSAWRALQAKSLDELRALDMRAHGIPCARCGKKAEEHPDFPKCEVGWSPPQPPLGQGPK